MPSATPPPTPSTRTLLAVASGLATTAYYASPDVIRSRTARGWVKLALSGAVVATSVPELRRGLAESRAARDAADERVDARELWGSLPARRRAAVVAAGAAAATLSVVSVVAVERGVFRRGERRREAGVRFAHTRPAVAWGVLSTVLALLPDADGPGPRA